MNLPEWKKCQKLWEELGCPVPCYDARYLAARYELREALSSNQNGSGTAVAPGCP
jgi:hypothetical protein